MAETKGNIENAPGIEEQDDRLVAVTSVTEDVPHEADASSEPGPYDNLPLTRGAVSTNDPQHPIAQSLVEGAGAPTGPPEIDPSTYVAPNAYVQKGDKVEKSNAPSTAKK